MDGSTSTRSAELLEVLSRVSYTRGEKVDWHNTDTVKWATEYREAVLCFVNSYGVNTDELFGCMKAGSKFFMEFCIAFVTFMGRCKPAGEGNFIPPDARCMASQNCCEHLVMHMLEKKPDYIHAGAWREINPEESQDWRDPTWSHDLAWYVAAGVGSKGHKTLLQTLTGVCLKYLYCSCKWTKPLIDNCINRNLVPSNLKFFMI